MSNNGLPTHAYELKSSPEQGMYLEKVGKSDVLIIYSGLSDVETHLYLSSKRITNFTLIKVGLAPR